MDEHATDRVLLVRLRTPGRLVQEAMGERSLVVEAKNLLQACVALENVRPTTIIVSESFPPFEVEVLRTKAETGTRVHFAADDTDVETLIGLVDEGGERRRPPRL